MNETVRKKIEELYRKRDPRQYLCSKAAQEKIPVLGTFELTPRCNMNCGMCYIRMSEQEMQEHGRERTAGEWIKMAEECRKQGMVFLLLTGGEPFLRKDLREIMEALSKMGISVSMNSNGTLITEETIAWLKHCPPARINITLYGGCNETYVRLCRNPKGFDQAVKAIGLLRDAGILVGINYTYTRYNRKDMDQVYAFAKERGIGVRADYYIFPPIRSAKHGAMNEGVRTAPQEAGEAIFRAQKCVLPDEELLQLQNGIGLPDTEENCFHTAEEHMGCMAGRSSFWITWDGRMTPCGMMNEPVTRPFEKGFAACWQEIVAETEKIFLPTECIRCSNRKICGICGAIAKAEGQGDSSKKPEYLCEMTKAYAKQLRGFKPR